VLARKPQINLAAFEDKLVLPPKPDTIREADEKFRTAVADRQAGQAQHVEAARQYQGQLLGMPASLTRADVDKIGVALGALFTAEAEAQAARDESVEGYQQAVTDSLTGPLEEYRAALSELINQLDNLLGVGVRLHQASVSAGVKLPNSIAALSQNIQFSCVRGARQLIGSAR
jgi:hypothetical protein